MGVGQEQSTNDTAVKDGVVQLLQSSILRQRNISDKANIEMSRLIISINKNDVVKLRRSKRVAQYLKGIIDVFSVLGTRGTLVGLADSYSIVEFGKYVLNTINDPLKRFFGLSSDEGQVAALSLEEIERHFMNNDLSRKLSENYWAIDRNHGLLSGNQNLLLANQGLLSGNQETPCKTSKKQMKNTNKAYKMKILEE